VGGDTGVAFLAAERSPEQYVVRLRKGSKRPDLIAFGAENPAHVDGLAAKLATAGVPIVSEPRPLGTLGTRLRLPVLRRRRAHDRGLQRRGGHPAPGR
jgi:hypothetical protein